MFLEKRYLMTRFIGFFGHGGEDCTFETLEKQFRIRDQKVRVIGKIIHDYAEGVAAGAAHLSRL